MDFNNIWELIFKYNNKVLRFKEDKLPVSINVVKGVSWFRMCFNIWNHFCRTPSGKFAAVRSWTCLHGWNCSQPWRRRSGPSSSCRRSWGRSRTWTSRLKGACQSGAVGTSRVLFLGHGWARAGFSGQNERVWVCSFEASVSFWVWTGCLLPWAGWQDPHVHGHLSGLPVHLFSLALFSLKGKITH